jgi:transposase-like protein
MMTERYISEDLSNGYYRRRVKLFGKEESVRVPRTRKGGFRSKLLPEKWSRNREVGEKLLGVLLSMGYSRQTAKIILSELGIKVEEEDFQEFEGNMKQYIEAINTSPTDENTAFVYLDGHRMKIRTHRGVKVYTLYMVIGLNIEGKKTILYAGLEEGVEKASTWAQILKLLVGRGLKKPLMFITDDLSGLSEVIQSIFPQSDHQICLLHLFRSLKRNLPKKEAEKMVRFIKAEKERAGDYEETVERFRERVIELEREYPRLKFYLTAILDNAPRYWAFLKYPSPIHKHIYSTNPIEAVFRQIRRQEVNNMGFFASLDYAHFSIALVLESISSRWLKALPAFNDVSYELQLMVRVKFLTQN